MNQYHFDALTKFMSAVLTRRGASGVLTGILLGGMTAPVGSPARDIGTRKQKRQRRRRKRDRARRSNKPSGRCSDDEQMCTGECIAKSACCSAEDCLGPQICDEERFCRCPDDTKPCGADCIGDAECCTDDDCPRDPVCSGRACVCPTETPKLCGDACILADQCCGNADCPRDFVCSDQRVCACGSGTKPCDGGCIPDDDCCGDCPEGTTCQAAECKGSGESLYPDLRTLPATDLRFDVITGGTHVLRFSNTIWNAGEGRLEIEGDPRPKEDAAKKIYQNLYDAPVGGTLTSRKQVASDVVYHPNHQHFHFANFASYLLLQRDSDAIYRETTKKGTKTSFCIEDTERRERSFPSQYNSCGLDLQGLTPGWADTYGAHLADQWIVLGGEPLADGEYAVQSIADPKAVLNEGARERKANNTAVTYFSVRGGHIEDVREEP